MAPIDKSLDWLRDVPPDRLRNIMANAEVFRPVEFPGLCAMGLALGKEVKIDRFNSSMPSAQIDDGNGKMTYFFINEEAKATFMKDPQGNLAKARAHRWPTAKNGGR